MPSRPTASGRTYSRTLRRAAAFIGIRILGDPRSGVRWRAPARGVARRRRRRRSGGAALVFRFRVPKLAPPILNALTQLRPQRLGLLALLGREDLPHVELHQ